MHNFLPFSTYFHKDDTGLENFKAVGTSQDEDLKQVYVCYMSRTSEGRLAETVRREWKEAELWGIGPYGSFPGLGHLLGTRLVTTAVLNRGRIRSVLFLFKTF